MRNKETELNEKDDQTKTEANNGPSPDNPPDNASKPSESQDLFDLEKLRLSQDFEEIAGVKKKIISVPVKKPDRQWFVRVHPDESYRLETAVLELKEDHETYLVAPSLWAESPDIVPKVLLTTINRQGDIFIWPIRLPGQDGQHDTWNASALEAVQIAITSWIRVTSKRSLSAYEVFEATGTIPEPKWPDLSFQELLRIAFKDRFIDSLDHPVLRKLRGEI